MQAGKKDIQGIFNRSWNLVIPFFQRSYVWGEEEWERFLSDMYDICQYKQEYFLGSVILKKYSEENQSSMVVDGQQRLTTLVLLFKVLLLKQDKNLQFDNVFKKIDDNKSILIHSKHDRKSFELILNLGSLQYIENPINKVEECFNFFVDYLDEEKLNFFDLLKYVALVGIELDANENEQQIFDTINSLGVKLTSAELLKSLLFRSDEIEYFEKYWQLIFEKDEETIEYWHTTANKKDGKTLIDILFFSFLQIQSKDLNPRERAGFGKIANLLTSYKKFLSTIEDRAVFFKDFGEYANIFRQFINPKIAEERLETQMDRINLIIFEGGLFSIIPYVMFILMHYRYAPEQRDEVLFVLECYLIRRMLGIEKGTLIAKDYAELFGTRLIVNNVISANALKIHFNGYKESHLHYMPNNNQINLLLKNKPQIQAKAKLILYLLDNKLRKDKGAEALYGFDKYSIEYLMPIKWQKSWSQPINMEVRKLAIKTLGNMTITPQKLNNTLKEESWRVRVEGKGKAKGLNAYSHLSFIKPILHAPQWTDDKIFENNERLAKLIAEVWKLS